MSKIVVVNFMTVDGVIQSVLSADEDRKAGSNWTRTWSPAEPAPRTSIGQKQSAARRLTGHPTINIGLPTSTSSVSGGAVDLRQWT